MVREQKNGRFITGTEYTKYSHIIPGTFSLKNWELLGLHYPGYLFFKKLRVAWAGTYAFQAKDNELFWNTSLLHLGISAIGGKMKGGEGFYSANGKRLRTVGSSQCSRIERAIFQVSSSFVIWFNNRCSPSASLVIDQRRLWLFSSRPAAVTEGDIPYI
jgi:hypothetical protein